MKRRIHLLLSVVAAIAIMLTLLVMSIVFYNGFKKQVFSDLQLTAHLYVKLDYENILKMEEDHLLKENIRLTLINHDGSVAYDNNADIGALDNHGDREEVIEALKSGKGFAVRQSSTVGKTAYYYAVLLDDGTILRIAKVSDSIFSIFYQSITLLIGITFLLIALSTVLTRYFTKKLIEPIEYLAGHLDEKEKIQTYSELTPVVDKIYKQHEDIKKGAQMRQDFTANVSHELKTPLTSISGYAELIESGIANEEDTVRFAREIGKSSKRLLTLINDIIRLSELDATEAEPTFEKVNLYQLAKNCTEMLQVNAGNHGVTLTFYGEECEVYSTKETMEELIYNLCDNAIRYNYEGGTVHVTTKMKGEKTVFTVKDTGIGIPKKHQERIFERFYRVDKSRSKSTGGTGLGLAIVKHIVAQTGAEMELNSEEGEGTEITITFPKCM